MKVYKGYQFRPAVEELILKVAAHFKQSVIIYWSDSISTAGIDRNKRIMLANVKDDAVMTHRDLIKWVGFGVHELLHALYTDFDVRGHDRYLDALHNAVEDAWIEHKGINKGLTGNIAPLLADLLDNMVQSAIKEVTDWSDPRQYPFVLAVYLRDHAVTKVPLADGLEPIFIEAKRRLNNAQSSFDTLAIAQWVYEQLDALPDDNQQDDGSSNDDPQGEQGDQDGEGEGEGQQDGQQDGKQGGKQQGNGKAKRFNPAEAVNPEPTLEIDEKRGASGTYTERFVKGNPIKDHHDQWADLTVNIPAKLRYEVRRLFENSGLDEFIRNRKSGSVDVTALPTHSFNDRLFKLRRSEDGIDTACVILVDASGSMYSDGGRDRAGNPLRMLNALKTSAALLDTLKRAQVTTAVIAFGDYACVLKAFNTSTPKAIADLSRLSDLGSTNDYLAVRKAHTMLLNRPEQRKICFVITDGEGDKWSTKEQCEIGTRLGITTIGIGIDLDVKDVYPQSVTVRDIAQLGAVSFNKIKLAA
jgi:Mg-chelatase subunit ChlD